jgi:predicted DNA-binding protein
MAQPRGYNSEKHSALPYVDKEYKELLNRLADETGRTKKKALELAIVDAAIHNHVSK